MTDTFKNPNLTVCPGRSDPPEKLVNIFAICIRKWGYTPFINYHDTLGWIFFVYRAK